MRDSYQGFRVLLVHAHPDDETINNGATMAMYAALGASVTLVTCTRGEEGEVLIPELSHLAASATDSLGQHRITELALAMKELGVADHRFLGEGVKLYRDSGMMGTEWDIPKIYWNVMPVSVIQEGIDAMKGIDSDFWGAEKAEDLPFAKDDSFVHALVDGNAYVDKKMNAMKAHSTQIAVDGPFFALSNNVGLQVWGNEYYTLVKGEKSAPLNEKGFESDLFAGISL